MSMPTIRGITLHKLLGTGGMGAVYAGVREGTGEPVAVKVLLAENPPEAAKRRFEREARAMASVRHPNLCRAFEFGTLSGGRLYLVMERLRGEDLGQHMDRRGRLSCRDAVAIVGQAAAGLAEAHAQGLVHRDLKPSNIFLHEPREGGPAVAKVLDFGLAVFAAGSAGETRVTQTGDIVGTPAYMAPEQARGAKTEDARTDVYGLAAVLYAALAGTPPYGVGTTLEVLVRLLTEEPTPLFELRSDVPAPLRALIMQCLKRDPAARLPDMPNFGAALAALESTLAAGNVIRDRKRTVMAEAVTLIGEQRVLTVMLARGAENETRVVELIAEQGGRAVALGGGHVVGLFGGEALEGGEAERAVRAALLAKDLCRGVGVGTGRASGGGAHFSGDAFQRAETATRLAEDGVLVDAETQKRVRGRFHFDGEQVMAEVTVRAERQELPYIGRELELAEVRGHVLRAFEDEEPACVLAQGPPGIGRTRLLAEVVAAVLQAEPETFLVELRCDKTWRYRAWSVVGTALLRWAGLPDDVPAEQLTQTMRRMASEAELDPAQGHFFAAAMGVPLPLGLSPAMDAAARDAQVMRDQMVYALGDLLESLAVRQPLLIVIDDVHHGDTASLEALDVLLRRLDFARLALVCAGRSEPHEVDLVHNPRVHRVALRELSKKAAARLAVLAGVPAEVADELAEHAGGNPLFVEEIAQSVAAGDYDASGSGQRFRLPLTVEEAIQARLDALEPSDKDTVKLASVFGVSFFREGLEALGVREARHALVRLKRENLVLPARRRRGEPDALEGHRFRVGVVREVAYAMLTDSQRTRVHGRVAAWLEEAGQGGAAEVAEHLEQAGLVVEAALRWSRAAREAEAAGDLENALRFLARALPSLSGLDAFGARLSRLRLAMRTGNVTLGGAESEAIASFEGEVPAALEPTLLRWQAELLRFQGKLEECAEVMRRALPRLDADELSGALCTLAITLAVTGSPGADEVLDRALGEAGSATDRARVFQVRSYVASMRGEQRAAREALISATAACQEAGDLRRGLEVDIGLAYHETLKGRYEQGVGLLEWALDRARRIGIRPQQAWALVNLGGAYVRLGRVGEASAALDEAGRIGRELDYKPILGAVGMHRALVTLESGVGNLPEAANEVLRCFKGTSHESIGHTLLGMWHMQRGETQEALAACEAAMAIRGDGPIPELEMELLLSYGDALLASGRVEEGGRMLAEARAGMMKQLAATCSTPEEEQDFIAATPGRRRVYDATLND